MQIAAMTPAQQLMMLELEANTLTFRDEKEYAEWLRNKSR